MKASIVAYVVAALHLSITACRGDSHGGVQAELANEKRGQVVDTNGTALPNVRVIAIWDISHRGFNGSNMSCAFQRMTTTDSGGTYVFSKEGPLPISGEGENSGWLYSILSGNYTRNDLSWRLVVFKQGYVVAEDAKALAVAKYLPSVGFRWQGGFRPDSIVVDSIVHVDPIAMTPEHLSGAQQIVLYDRLNSALLCSPIVPLNRDVESVRRQILDDALSVPCSMPPEEVLAGEIVKTFADLAKGRAVWDALVKLGEPSSGAEWHELTARQVCDASREGDTK